MNINDILEASFGETSDKLRVNFKKTILVQQYETEVFEAETEVELDHKITGAERVFLTALMKAQMEYTVYVDLYVKKQITKDQYEDRKKDIITTMSSIKAQAEQVLGYSLDKYIKSEIDNTAGVEAGTVEQS